MDFFCENKDLQFYIRTGSSGLHYLIMCSVSYIKLCIFKHKLKKKIWEQIELYVKQLSLFSTVRLKKAREKPLTQNYLENSHLEFRTILRLVSVTEELHIPFRKTSSYKPAFILGGLAFNVGST